MVSQLGACTRRGATMVMGKDAGMDPALPMKSLLTGQTTGWSHPAYTRYGSTFIITHNMVAGPRNGSRSLLNISNISTAMACCTERLEPFSKVRLLGWCSTHNRHDWFRFHLQSRNDRRMNII